MKKFFLFIFLAFTLGANAQSVSVSRMESDGRWQIMMSGKNVSLNGADYNICLKAYVKNGEPDFCILISSFNTIPENAEVLFKLGNGETMYLPINNLNVGEVNTGYSTTKYYSSIYDISESDLNILEVYGILKMRITGGSSYREKVWSKDKLGRFLEKSRLLIEKEISKHVTSNIWDGF